MIQESCYGYDINIYLPVNYRKEKQYPALFLNDGDCIQQWGKCSSNYFIFGIIPKNRLMDYTPWKADAIRENAQDFGGNAEVYIYTLVNKIIPMLKSRYNLAGNKIAFGGISLGGLAAIYSLYLTNRFEFIFSICGSFWFPGFVEFVQTEQLINNKVQLFILNGSKEGANHDNILEEAPQKARAIQNILSSKIQKSSCVFDEYGHHENMTDRIKCVQTWLEDKLI